MAIRDYHTHTLYCDGNNTPREMVEAAIKKGMSSLGICTHSYTHFDTSYCIKKQAIPRFIAEIHYLHAEYRDRIQVLCGVEQDFYSEESSEDFDYVIGSVHYLKCGDAFIPIDESANILKDAIDRFFEGDPYALCEAYFSNVSQVVEKTQCDIIGHFDLVSKFNEQYPLFDTKHSRYVNAWKNAVDILLDYDTFFEINTGAISRGYKTEAYPSREMIDYMKQRGARFLLSSDAHNSATLAYKFSDYETYTEVSYPLQ